MLLKLATNKAAKIRAKNQVFTQGEAALSKKIVLNKKNKVKQGKRKKFKKYTVSSKKKMRLGVSRSQICFTTVCNVLQTLSTNKAAKTQAKKQILRQRRSCASQTQARKRQKIVLNKKNKVKQRKEKIKNTP